MPLAPNPVAPASAVADDHTSKEDCLILAIPTKLTARVPTWRKRVLETVGDRPLEEVVEEVKKQRTGVEMNIAQAAENEQEKLREAELAKAAFTTTSSEVDTAIAKELETARAYAELVLAQKKKASLVEAARRDLYEAQKKVSMLEVLVVGHAKMKALEATRIEARRAAEEAKKAMLESKQQHKNQQKEIAAAMRRAMASGQIIQLDPIQIDIEETANESQKLVETPAPVDSTLGVAAHAPMDTDEKDSGVLAEDTGCANSSQPVIIEAK